eukprot:128119_1
MKGILTMMMLVSVINVVMAGYLHPQYGFAHRVNDEDNIASLLNTDINGIELDVCRGYSIWNGWNWYVSHNDLGVCNNPSAVTLTDWLKELKNENPSNKPLAMLWLDVKTPGDTSMGELVDDVHNAGLPSNIKILYDLTAFNADSRAGFDRIYYKLNTNEGISFCAGKSCGSDINLIKQIYDYYKSKYFTRGTFNTGDSIDIDEDFIHYANSPLFNDPTDPFRFKAIFTWTNGEQNSMQDHMRPWPDLAYTDGQIIGSWILEWNSPNHHSYIDKFKSAVNNYPLETLATSSINPFTTYQRRSTYIILDTISKDWLDAQSVCAVNYGGRLATLITNKQIQIAHQLRINSEYSNTESLWIGLNNIFTGGEWQWDSEHMCSYTGNSNCNNDAHWNVGQPTDFSGQGCAVLLVDNSYHNSFDDIPCSLSKGYLCDSPNEYILIQQKKTWQNAQDHCRNKYGTNLATVVTDDQISKLMQVIPETETIFWVGLNDRNTNGNWEWASSYSCSYAPNGQCKYDTHWAVNEPNAVNINHCAAFIITIDVELSASACTDVSYFYCDSSIESSIWSPPSKSPSKSPSKLPSKSPSNAPTTKQFSEIRSLVLNENYDTFLSYLSERNIQVDAAALSLIDHYINLKIPSLSS